MKVTMKLAVLVAVATMLITGCGKNDSISQAKKKDVAQGVPAPSIEETKAIAEEGFIYGLPLVMNYAVKYAFAVDRNSASSRLPSMRFTTRPSLHLQGHGHRHSQQ